MIVVSPPAIEATMGKPDVAQPAAAKPWNHDEPLKSRKEDANPEATKPKATKQEATEGLSWLARHKGGQ